MPRTTPPPMNSRERRMPSRPSSNWQIVSTMTSGLPTSKLRRLREFLGTCSYPHLPDWTDDHFRDSTICLRRTGGSIDVAVWFFPLGGSGTSMHLCASPGVRGRWVSPRALRVLSDAARASGFARVTVPVVDAGPHLGLLARLGFTANPLDYTYNLDLYGKAQSRQGP